MGGKTASATDLVFTEIQAHEQSQTYVCIYTLQNALLL